MSQSRPKFPTKVQKITTCDIFALMKVNVLLQCHILPYPYISLCIICQSSRKMLVPSEQPPNKQKSDENMKNLLLILFLHLKAITLPVCHSKFCTVRQISVLYTIESDLLNLQVLSMAKIQRKCTKMHEIGFNHVEG